MMLRYSGGRLRSLLSPCYSFMRLLSTVEPLSSKVYLRPVMKLLHPDLFSAFQDAQVSETNLRSIQDLQSLSSMVDELVQEAFLSNAVGGTVTVKVPFEATYDLDCYLKTKISPTGDGINEEEVLSKVKMTIKTPKELCKRHMLQKNTAKVALLDFLQQYGKFWEGLALEHPWKSLLLEHQSHSNNHIGTHVQAGLGSMEQQFLREASMHIFDRTVIQQHRLKVHDQVFDNVKKFNKRGRDLKHKMEIKKFTALIDSFIKSGHVKLKDVSVTKEMEVVLKMRTFLEDFGDLIKFGSPEWSSIYFILQEHNTHLATKDSVVFSYQVLANSHVLVVPINFKSKELLRFIHKSLPFTMLSI